MMSEFAAVAMNDTAVEKCRVIREALRSPAVKQPKPISTAPRSVASGTGDH
jgi:hypothetical protein